MNENIKAPARFLTEEAIWHGVDLTSIGYRHIRAGLDIELAKFGLGQAHHRAIYFIHQVDDISPTELMRYLGVTKQSLSRVMLALESGGFIGERPDSRDRRVKCLFLTDRGLALEEALYESMKGRLKAAYSDAGPRAVQGFWNVLAKLSTDGTASPYDRLQAHRIK